MIIDTYQSEAVARILRSGQVYYAMPSITYKKEYAALIDILGLYCECPIFGVVRGRKQNTGGRVSGSVRLRLRVPDERVKLTEFSVWTNFMQNIRFTRPNDYKTIAVGVDEIDGPSHARLIEDLRCQRKLSKYKEPQAILEYIDPAWVVRYQYIKNTREAEDRKERFLNLFRR